MGKVYTIGWVAHQSRLQPQPHKIDRHLLIALVERWRSETHRFHLVVGEMTITLEDTLILLGDKVHCDPVTSVTGGKWSALCIKLLRRVLANDEWKKGSSRLSFVWLWEQFSTVPEEAGDVVRR